MYTKVFPILSKYVFDHGLTPIWFKKIFHIKIPQTFRGYQLWLTKNLILFKGHYLQEFLLKTTDGIAIENLNRKADE